MPEPAEILYFDLHLKIEPDPSTGSEQELQKRLAIVAYLGGFDAPVATALARGNAETQKVCEVIARIYLATVAQRLLLDHQYSVEFWAVQVRPGSFEIFAKIKARLKSAAAAAVVGFGVVYPTIEHVEVIAAAAKTATELVESNAGQKAQKAFVSNVENICKEIDTLLGSKTTVGMTPSKHHIAQPKPTAHRAGGRTHRAHVSTGPKR
jgi:hypothetical protein